MEKISAPFRMGMREARKAMTGGGLMASVNLGRMEQVAEVLVSGDPSAICAALHEMAGPFNPRMLSTDIDSAVVANADLMSTRLAITIVSDVVKPGGSALDTLKAIAEGMCDWIDSGVPVQGVPAEATQSGMAARLIADSSSYPVDSPGAAMVRLHCISRFSPAIGAIETVLRIPADIPATIVSHGEISRKTA